SLRLGSCAHWSAATSRRRTATCRASLPSPLARPHLATRWMPSNATISRTFSRTLPTRCNDCTVTIARPASQRGIPMERTQPMVTPWSEAGPPSEAAIRRLYEREGLRPYQWGNAPGDTYAAHSHSYAKVIYVVSGAITFGLPASHERLTLRPGDRLDLPAN